MSEQEQNEVLGRMVSEHAAVRKQCALLREELGRFGDLARKLAFQIENEHPVDPIRAAEAQQIVAEMYLAGFTTQCLQTLLADYIAATQRLAQLKATLRELGVD